MGGVDLVDKVLYDCRSSIHGEKWYWPFLVNVLNISFVYCWKLFRIATGEQIEQKAFRRQIMNFLLRCSVQATPARSHPGRTYWVANEIRLDGVQHYPALGPVRKCAICKKYCRNTCSKCDQSLHVSVSFQLFHEK